VKKFSTRERPQSTLGTGFNQGLPFESNSRIQNKLTAGCPSCHNAKYDTPSTAPFKMWLNQIAFKMQSGEKPSCAKKKSVMHISGWKM